MTINFPKIEEEILKFWEKNKIFEKSLKKKSPKGDFIFYEGPPFANGRPGVHHILVRAYKDVVARYKTMRGYFVERLAGWDTHGLPAEMEAEKILKIRGKQDIEKIGIRKFVEVCRKSIFLYIDEWEKMTKRMGYWIELKNAYITCSNDYIETLWWIIERIWEGGLLYQDYKVVPHCPRCGTTLSSHEVAQGYKNIEEVSVYLKFQLRDSSGTQVPKYPIYLLVWTTTPWTLTANVALAINKNVRYVKILKDDQYWILAKNRLGVVERPFEIVDEFPGEKLLGLRYQPLFEFVQPKKPSWFVIHGDFVSTEDGTGIVHIAPAFGEEDLEVGKENNLPILITVELDGKISPEVGPWAGKWVKEADPLIIEDLKKRNILIGIEKIRHDYPFCWRCDTPLLYYAKQSWFIKMSDPRIKQALIESSQEINWVPRYIKEGRFGEWLAGIKDWAISRERYWGTPLPIWECESCNYRECIGSFAELEYRTGKKIPKNFDPHRPCIDEWTWQCPRCNGQMKRVPEVLDCWFDSGAMPFAQWHYPFEQKEKIDGGRNYPADFICEAIDQTRGWFYSLLAISTLLDKGTCYKNVICLGHVLDAQGQKMSKSRGNVVSWEVINEHGADPVRWYLYTLNQPGENKPFIAGEIISVIRRFFLTLWNCLEFYKLYAEFPPRSTFIPRESSHVLDKWILAKLNLLIKEASSKIDTFDITGSGRELEAFIIELSQWYLRRSRDRFSNADKKSKEFNQSCQTFYHILVNLTKLIAPFIPFLAEKLYLDLTKGKIKKSVHLEDWPETDEKLIKEELLTKMEFTRKICEVGHASRARAKIKVRQPLQKLKIKNKRLKIEPDLVDLIKDELNVKEVEFVDKLPEGDEWIVSRERDTKLALNIKITPELKKEGLGREIVRQINALRKEAKLTKKDLVNVYYETPSDELKKIMADEKDFFKAQTVSKNILEKKIPTQILARKTLVIEDKKITIALLGARHRL